MLFFCFFFQGNRKYILNVLFIEQEADSQFRYIALELCLATVQDLITGKTQYTYKMDAIDILFQAMSGISYLHSLDIGKQTLSNFDLFIKDSASKFLIGQEGDHSNQAVFYLLVYHWLCCPFLTYQ